MVNMNICEYMWWRISLSKGRICQAIYVTKWKNLTLLYLQNGTNAVKTQDVDRDTKLMSSGSAKELLEVTSKCKDDKFEQTIDFSKYFF